MNTFFGFMFLSADKVLQSCVALEGFGGREIYNAIRKLQFHDAQSFHYPGHIVGYAELQVFASNVFYLPYPVTKGFPGMPD